MRGWYNHVHAPSSLHSACGGSNFADGLRCIFTFTAAAKTPNGFGIFSAQLEDVAPEIAQVGAEGASNTCLQGLVRHRSASGRAQLGDY